MDLSRKGLRRNVGRLGKLGLERLSESRVGQRLQRAASSDRASVQAARFVVELVAERLREEIGKRLAPELESHTPRRDAPETNIASPEPARGAATPLVTDTTSTSPNDAPAMSDAPVASDIPETTPEDPVAAPKVARARRGAGEPIRTVTMARLLASQGAFDRARKIYDHLLDSDPDDLILLAEREDTRLAELVAAGKPVPSKADGTAGLRVHHEHGHVVVEWAVSPESLDPLRARTERDGKLAVRAVVLPPAGELLARPQVHEHTNAAWEGTWSVSGVPSGARYLVALGLRTDARFIPLRQGPLHIAD
ncbi:MAG: hypothetical protein R3A78_02760 [Polyangiales bacterium]|nr:hypothetical protein [Myxococcales bacterium]